MRTTEMKTQYAEYMEAAAAEYKEAEGRHGTLAHDGKILAFTQQAYASQRGHYAAEAIDVEGNRYTVRWETTAEWDEAEENYDGEGDAGILGEESNACDWDHPVEVELYDAALSAEDHYWRNFWAEVRSLCPLSAYHRTFSELRDAVPDNIFEIEGIRPAHVVAIINALDAKYQEGRANKEEK